MTDMRRVTISIPDEIDQRVLAMRKEDEYARCTYSEIVRRLVLKGLEKAGRSAQESA